MATYYYLCNSFDGDYTAWSEVGSSPYLDAVDYPTNYIYLTGGGVGGYEGDFGFADSGSEKSETLAGVELELYCRGDPDPDIGFAIVFIDVWDGTSWTTYIGSITMGSSWAWRACNIYSAINSWEKIDACQVRLKCIISVSETCVVDAARLKVSTKVPIAKRPFIKMDLGPHPRSRLQFKKSMKNVFG